MNNSNTNYTQQILIRNAFLSGALSASLIWTLAIKSLRIRDGMRHKYQLWRRKSLSPQRTTLVEDDCNIGGGDGDGDGDGDGGGGNSHHEASTSTAAIRTTTASGLPSPSSIIYNPWSRENSSQSDIHQYQDEDGHEVIDNNSNKDAQLHVQLHLQLLELRTSLIEHSKRTSLLLLDKILNDGNNDNESKTDADENSDSDGGREAVKGNIGEIPRPKKRMRWPWESLRKHLTKTDENGSVSGDGDSYTGGINEQDRNGTEEGSDGSNKQGLKIESDSASIHANAMHGPQSASNSVTSEDVPDGNSLDICIGSIFGLDVGGTLAKLVYFEKKRDSNDTRSHSRDKTPDGRVSSSAANLDIDYEFGSENGDYDRRQQFQQFLSHSISSFEHMNLHPSCSEDDLQSTHYPLHTASSVSNLGSPEVKLKRSHSLFDLSSKKAKREEALDRFYEFANNLDVYDTEVKDKALSFYSRALGGEVHFIQFETRYLPQAMDLIRINDLHLNISKMGATGGGAHKYSDKWEQMLGIEIAKQDELDSLVAGMQFIMSDVVGECYTYVRKEGKVKEKADVASTQCSDNNDCERRTKVEESTSGISKEEDSKSTDEPRNTSFTRRVKRDCVAKSDSYPYLLVMIGTGVSVIRVDGPRKHERISGSTIGGGTYWGLCRLLTDVEDFESVLNLAEKGDPSKVDMMVGDIYGKDSHALDKLGLTTDIVASSFGKLVASQDPAAGLKQEDLARALLLMVTNNIGQVAYLNAQLHHTKNIYFVGNFLRHNTKSQEHLSYAINYWSRGEMEALFLEHEGYFGALGAFLLHQGISADKDGKLAQAKVESQRSQKKTRFSKKRSLSL